MERGSTCIASRWWQRLLTLVGCWRRANQTGEGAAHTQSLLVTCLLLTALSSVCCMHTHHTAMMSRPHTTVQDQSVLASRL